MDVVAPSHNNHQLAGAMGLLRSRNLNSRNNSLSWNLEDFISR
jgi:hypothetical protein